jgi:two-component system sensor histidine kinase KdpD
MDAPDVTPSPEPNSLSLAQAPRGRMKLFLGAAPGVGKTCEMLREGHAKRSQGVDVVIGVVETHKRTGTQELIRDLEILPRCEILYRGHILREMDVDAIIKRKPELVLVDELAHTNAETSRHPKRWMDVVDLLDAGIDVYATMNVQHLESANEVVAKVTSIIVRETVPDSILDLANDIEIVDITPDELQQRMRDGKIYPAEVASRALSSFFTTGNLTMLRELALRRTAERVDEAMRAHREAQGIRETWDASERIVACIDGGPSGANVVRRAKRLAERLRAPWMVVHVAKGEAPDAPTRANVLETFRLAEELGAHTRMLTGDDSAGEVLAFARDHNASHLIVGAAARPWVVELVHGSMIRRLVREAGDIAVVVCPQSQTKPARRSFSAATLRFGTPEGYVSAAIMVAVASGLAVAADRLFSLPNASLFFVIPIILAAIQSGAAVSMVTAIVAMLAYNYFLTPPLYTFTISNPHNVFAVVFFLAIGFITSGVAAQARARLLLARRQERQSSDLQDFAIRLVTADSKNDAGQITAETIAAQLKGSALVLLMRDGQLELGGEAPGPAILAPSEEAAAHWTFDHGGATGRGADTLPGGRWLFVPIPGELKRCGVIGFMAGTIDIRLDPEQRRLLNLIAAQAGVAIERATYAQQAEAARMEAQSDRLKGVLLSSISHDLRTPLATISTALQTLHLFGKQQTAKERSELIELASSETARLSGFVEHLLDIVRIDAGAVTPRLEPVEISDLVAAALARAEPSLNAKQVNVDCSPALPRVLVDYQLTLAALANVLENAGKHTPDTAVITIRARRVGDRLAIDIADTGAGIPPDLSTNLFGKFTRGAAGDGRPPGTGLGLAITKGFLEVQGATISCQPRPEGTGTVFRIDLPLAGVMALQMPAGVET